MPACGKRAYIQLPKCGLFNVKSLFRNSFNYKTAKYIIWNYKVELLQ